MPLVIFTGYASSGKTTCARRLAEALEARVAAEGTGHRVVYHSDDTLGIARDAYRDAAAEKHARGAQMAAVKRHLSRSTIVILDTMAYIKGFRYQLYCEAKGLETPHCVVHVLNAVDTCLEWDARRGGAWDEALVRQLAMRYEEPNGATRWDAPLFAVAPSQGDALDADAVWDALVLRRAPPPNAATVVKPTAGNDFLQHLDASTAAVVRQVWQHQQSTPGGRVQVGPAVWVELPASVSMAQLQRVRRTFVALNRMRAIDVERITALFAAYLEQSLH